MYANTNFCPLHSLFPFAKITLFGKKIASLDTKFVNFSKYGAVPYYDPCDRKFSSVMQDLFAFTKQWSNGQIFICDCALIIYIIGLCDPKFKSVLLQLLPFPRKKILAKIVNMVKFSKFLNNYNM